jgi:hypothetical protein
MRDGALAARPTLLLNSFKETQLVLSEKLIVPFRRTEFPVGKFKFHKGFFDPASGKRTPSETAPRAAPLALTSQKTLRTRSLQRRYLIRRTSDEKRHHNHRTGDTKRRQTLMHCLAMLPPVRSSGLRNAPRNRQRPPPRLLTDHKNDQDRLCAVSVI